MNTVLLLCAVIVLLLILRAMPLPFPTQAEVDKSRANPNQRKLLDARLPAVAIEGQIEVVSDMMDPLYIQTDPTGGHPLQIDDTNPIAVTIQK